MLHLKKTGGLEFERSGGFNVKTAKNRLKTNAYLFRWA